MGRAAGAGAGGFGRRAPRRARGGGGERVILVALEPGAARAEGVVRGARRALARAKRRGARRVRGDRLVRVVLLVGVVRAIARGDDLARLLQGSLERGLLTAEGLRNRRGGGARGEARVGWRGRATRTVGGFERRRPEGGGGAGGLVRGAVPPGPPRRRRPAAPPPAPPRAAPPMDPERAEPPLAGGNSSLNRACGRKRVGGLRRAPSRASPRRSAAPRATSGRKRPSSSRARRGECDLASAPAP